MTDLVVSTRPDRTKDFAIIRAWLYTYRRDRLGRDASPESVALAHDALDRLERGEA